MFAALNSFLTRAVSGYFLNKSLRFRSSASAYLNRTPATASNRKTMTFSAWVKRGTLGAQFSTFWSAGSGSPNPRTEYDFSYDTLYLGLNPSGSTWYYIQTNAVYRDPAAWYHIVIAIDTTQATSTDIVKLYVNGVQVTSFASYSVPPQNTDLPYNNTVAHYLGQYAGTGQNFDGELAEVNFVDGQALAPTSFGAFSTYNQWLPIKYAGTYGTNGFYLPFTNTTSTTTLVADSSGNANNWTPNNISLTAGSTYDLLTDVQTLTSATVANYAVLNPLDSANPALSINGNLSWVNAAASHLGIRGSIAIPASGAFYMECVTGSTTNNTSAVAFGLGASTVSLTATLSGQANLYQLWAALGGYIYNGATVISSSLGAFSAGDVMQIAVDVTNTKMWLGKNNVWYNSSGGTTGNPSTGANPTFTTSMVGLFPTTGAYANSVNANFGQQPFTYTPPSGFLPLNTFNI